MGKIGPHIKQKPLAYKAYTKPSRKPVQNKVVSLRGLGAIGSIVDNFGGKNPLIIIDFPADKHYVHFASKLRERLATVSKPKSDEFYYVISVTPSSSGVSRPLSGVKSPKANLHDVTSVMKQQGIPRSHISVLSQTTDDVDGQEIWVFNTKRSECPIVEKHLIQQTNQPIRPLDI